MRRGLGLAWRWYGEARGPGGAGCCGTRKLLWQLMGRGQGCEAAGAGVFERGAWAASGEAGVEASGQAGEACRWRAAWERGRAGVEVCHGAHSETRDK